MLSLEDCLGLCDLTEGEVLAIAEHEHIPEIAAVQLGNYLAHTPEGEKRIKAMIRDDLTEARWRGDREHELALKLLLRDFVLTHPHCEERHRRRLDPDQVPPATAASLGDRAPARSSRREGTR